MRAYYDHVGFFKKIHRGEDASYLRSQEVALRSAKYKIFRFLREIFPSHTYILIICKQLDVILLDTEITKKYE